MYIYICACVCMCVCVRVCVCVCVLERVCKQTLTLDIISCALSWASQHQARNTYSNKHHVASHKTRRFSVYAQTSSYTHVVPP